MDRRRAPNGASKLPARATVIGAIAGLFARTGAPIPSVSRLLRGCTRCRNRFCHTGLLPGVAAATALELPMPHDDDLRWALPDAPGRIDVDLGRPGEANLAGPSASIRCASGNRNDVDLGDPALGILGEHGNRLAVRRPCRQQSLQTQAGRAPCRRDGRARASFGELRPQPPSRTMRSNVRTNAATSRVIDRRF